MKREIRKKKKVSLKSKKRTVHLRHDKFVKMFRINKFRVNNVGQPILSAFERKLTKKLDIMLVKM